jgi:hypothetical protein
MQGARIKEIIVKTCTVQQLKEQSLQHARCNNKRNNCSNMHGAKIKINNCYNMHGATIKDIIVTTCTVQH